MNCRLLLVPLVVFGVLSGPAQAADCPALLQGELPKLRAKETIDLCQYAGKPLVVVNTASHCGFVGQFSGLETLYQRYRDEGLEVLGVPSDDFKQEAEDSAITAKVCYGNYGVTFAMTEPQPVTGAQAIPLFRQLTEQSAAPSWNFFKYVVDRKGQVIGHFSSRTEPDDPALLEAIEQAIASTP